VAVNDPLRAMLAGAIASVTGIVIAASGSGTAGGAITLGGWLVLVVSIHRYGRTGSDEKI
jgi:hypothetical protein